MFVFVWKWGAQGTPSSVTDRVSHGSLEQSNDQDVFLLIKRGNILTVSETWHDQIETLQIPKQPEEIKIIKGIIRGSSASPPSR